MSIINKENLKNIIQILDKASVLVIGDFALDEMIYGNSTESQEKRLYLY